MRGINKAIVIGNVGRDPEIRALPGGSTIANLSVATSEHWKDSNGQKQERTEWHKVVVFGKLAEIVESYVTKGMPVYVEGALRTRQWEKDGVKHYTTEIVAREIQMLGRGAEKPESNRPRDEEYRDDDIPF